ncbi:MAG: polysaccharide deacetylase family protein [Cellulosilyticum sp.]|nr:polysaccharide deacetylase family protein [Cellulosilyticum sp.]
MFNLEHPMIALTFDDGPLFEGSTATEILNTLHQYNLHATFFYCGHSITPHTAPEILTAYQNGHEIGNHTYHHIDLTTLTSEEMIKEFELTQRKLSEITGLNHFLTRAPYLSYNDLLLQTLPTPFIGTSVDSKDWSGISAPQIIDHILTQIHDGAIILMHENQPHTSEALPILIPKLLELGYQFTTVSHLMQLKGHTLHNGKVYNQA